MDFLKGFPAIIVICVNDKEGSVHQALDHKNGLPRPPWLCAPGRHLISGRKCIQLLISVFHRKKLFYPVTDYFLKILFQVLPDDENNLVKTCFHGIMDRIIHDDLPAWPHWFQLLDSSSKTASNPSRHDYQCSVFHCTFLL